MCCHVRALRPRFYFIHLYLHLHLRIHIVFASSFPLHAFTSTPAFAFGSFIFSCSVLSALFRYISFSSSVRTSSQRIHNLDLFPRSPLRSDDFAFMFCSLIQFYVIFLHFFNVFVFLCSCSIPHCTIPHMLACPHPIQSHSHNSITFMNKF